MGDVTAPAAERAVAAHRARWGPPDLVARAPGRVNLIGDHTDYNDGYTLPMALPFDTVVALSSDGHPDHGAVVITSEGFGDVELRLGQPVESLPSWARHLAGVVTLLAESGVPAGGWRAAIATDIPTGASLSSSAALEVAAITALSERAGRRWAPIEIARLGQRVENEVVGLPSGIMDQFISAGAVAGHVSLMDCRTLTLSPRRLPAEAVVAVMDTGTRRVLAEAAYGDRRADCERAAAALGVSSLRDAAADDIDQLTDPVLRRRVRHVVTENDRTLGAADALAAGDVVTAGALMTASHVSLRDDYEVSGPGLDRIVELALDIPGCLGARMTGGGFAGCAVALVRTDDAERFRSDLTDRYDHEGQRARTWLCQPGAGAGLTYERR